MFMSREGSCQTGSIRRLFWAIEVWRDHPAHPHRLISGLLFAYWKATYPVFLLVFAADETGLNLALLESTKTGFVVSRPSAPNGS